MKKTFAGFAASALFACGILSTSVAQAAYVNELESNDSFASAQNINPYFNLEFDADIGDVNGVNTSTTLAHASVRGTGDNTYDFYTFTTSGSSDIILDIDYGMGDVDTFIAIWSASTGLLAQNDDFSPYETVGAGGSNHRYDSFIQLTGMSADTYYVGVSRCCQGAGATGWNSGTEVPAGSDYTLHVSAVSAVPEPESVLLGLAGLAIVTSVRRFRRQSAA